MITLVEQPGEIVLNRNPVILKLRATDDTGKAYGPVAAQARLTLTGNSFADGDQIVLLWTDAEGGDNFLAFTATTIPNAEYQISARPGGESTAAYIARILPEFRAHPVIGSLFEIKATSTYIDFIAREKVDGWEVSFNLAGLDATFSNTPFTADDTPNEYRLLLDVFSEMGYQINEFEQLLQAKGLPDGNGYCTFNIQNLLLGAYKNSIPDPAIPSWGNDQITAAGTMRRYSLRYREDYQDVYTVNPIDGQWLALPPRKYMEGGVSQALFAEVDFLSSLNKTNSLLHWYPSGKKVGRDQPEYLAWYNYHSEAKEIQIQLVASTDSDTLAPIYPYDLKRFTVPAKEVCLIPIGPDILGLLSTVNKYTISVGYQDPNFINTPNDEQNGIQWEALSPTRTYYIDKGYHQSVKYLQYLNGFGVPETIRCIGSFSKKLAVSRSIIEKILQPDYTPTTAEIEQYDEVWENALIYRTGYLSKKEKDALQELIVNSQVYEVSSGGYIPLQVTNSKVDITETFQLLHSLEIAAKPRLNPRNYSNSEINIDPSASGWLLSSSGYWLGLVGKPWPIV